MGKILNRQQFLWMLQEMDGLDALAAEIGADRTQAIVDLVFDAQIRDTNPNDGYVMVNQTREAEYPDEINRILVGERDKIRSKQEYVITLLKATMAGDMRHMLEEMAEIESNYTVVRKLPPQGTRQREIAKAADWIASSMHGDGADQVRDCLTRHVLTEPAGVALGGTPADLLDRVHGEIAETAVKFRGPNPATAYPSSIGGRHLLEMVFKWTAKIIWPGPGEEIWYDVALFYLAAVATVQGYPDGNKRAARMAYALTLLKAEMPFVAPNLSLEGGLVDMEGAAAA